MKKILLSSIACILGLTLVACSNNKTTKKTTKDSTTNTKTTTKTKTTTSNSTTRKKEPSYIRVACILYV